MSHMQGFGFAVEYVSDVAAATRFYVDVLGLTVQREHPRFVQFDHFAVAADESPGGGSGELELYWLVDDADAAFREMSSQSAVVMRPKAMPFGTVFAVQGSAGRPCYLVELAAERPSRATS